MKIILNILVLLLISSCNFADGITISFKKLSNSLVELSGRIEKSFGQNGIVSLENMKTLETYISNISSCVYLVLVKNRTGSASANTSLIKLNANFEIERTFGEKRFLRIEKITPTFVEMNFLGADLSSNKFYLATGNKIIRFNPNGTLDSSFGVDGVFSMENTNRNYFPLHIHGIPAVAL